MRHNAFIVATLTGSLLFGASIAGALRAPVGAIGASGGAQAPDADAVTPGPAAARAAALAGAIVREFPGHAVDVAFEPSTVALADAGGMQQRVRGLARVRIDGSAPMRVRVDALYDPDARSVDAPSLRFEDAGERSAADTMRRALAVATEQRLGAEFADQPVSLSLAGAAAGTVGRRFLHVVAQGIADFGAEGRAATTIDALYDPRTGEWLRLDYALGADPADGADGFAYASR